MKTSRLINRKVITAFVLSLVSLFTFSNFLSSIDKKDILRLTSSINEVADTGQIKEKEEVKVADSISEYAKNDNVTPKVIVYDGMTMNELSAKLNRSLSSTISGKGELIASYSIEKGVDPYLAMGIMLLETGCNWTCSTLVQKCNNVGGQKGSPNCSGGYRSYPTLDDGIKGFIDNLADNYYAYGLTTPEAMNSKYAESTAWATKVRNYMSSVSAK
jgi:hypothetical protein